MPDHRTATKIALLLAFAVAALAPASADAYIGSDAISFDTGVVVHTDGMPAHWRAWRVTSTGRLAAHDRCQYRIDASRVLRDKPVTQSLPTRCMDEFTRGLRPDGAPRHARR